MSESVDPITPKQVLVQWTEEHGIGITDFANRMGYTYTYAWQLLRGKAEIKSDLLGRMVLAFGAESVREIATAMPELNGVRKGTGPLPQI